MQYFTVDSSEHVDLLRAYIQYMNELHVGVNMLHTHTKLANGNNTLSEFIDKEFFKAILDYMSFYAVKRSIGIEILRRNSIDFKDVVDTVFYKVDETFTVVYK